MFGSLSISGHELFQFNQNKNGKGCSVRLSRRTGPARLTCLTEHKVCKGHTIYSAEEFFLDGLKKLEQRSHKCVELGGEYVE
jgi:hypothetical protein